MRRVPLLHGVVLGVAWLLAGCGSTTMESIQRAPDFRTASVHHVMVIGVFNNQDLRNSLEKEFVNQWKTRGIDAVSSLDVLPSSTTLDKAGVAPIARAQGFDAVLVTRLLSKTAAHAEERAIRTIQPSTQSDAQNIDSVLQVLLAPPVTMDDHDIAILETNLYGVAEGKRLWSGRSETEVVGNVNAMIPAFVKIVLERLYSSP